MLMSTNKYSYCIRQTKEIKKKKTSDKIIYHMIFVAIYCMIKIVILISISYSFYLKSK